TSLRSKEEAQDYRYFPEPDLVPLEVSEQMLEAARAELPELPAARAERFERELGLDAPRARQLAFRGELGDFYEEALAGDGGDDALLPAVRDAIAANPAAAEKIRAGEMKAIGPIIGHVMRATQGRADGGEVTRLVRAELGV